VHDIDSALEVIRARDATAARLATGLWGAMRTGAAHTKVTRYDVQGVCWGALPLLARSQKGTAVIGDRYNAAAVLGELLDLLGYPDYAEICRGQTTRRILDAAENDDACAELVRSAWEHSGVEPPNTPILTWGEVRGPIEQAVHAGAGRILEEAIDDGFIEPANVDSEPVRVALMMRLLASPAEGLPGTWFTQIFGERLHTWQTAGGSSLRRELLVRVQPEVVNPPDVAKADPFPALATLLEAGRGNGIRLTRNGYLPTALVAELVELMPACEDYPPAGRSESMWPPVKWLRQLACRLDFMRLKANRLELTKLGGRCTEDADTMTMAVGEGMTAKDPSVRGVIQEVILAGLLLETRLDPDPLLDKVGVVITEEGWASSTDEGPQARELAVRYGTMFLRELHILDVLDVHRDMGLTEAGRAATRWALRARVMLREVPG
jgi:hypothetical protein